MGRMVRVVAAVAIMVILSTGAAFAATLGGTAAGDALRGTNGADTIRGGGGGDILRGMSGDNRLYGDCYDTLQKVSDQNLDRFVGCEKFVG